MKPTPMSDEHIHSICDVWDYTGTMPIRAVIAARDKQWAEMLGEPVGWMSKTGGFIDAHEKRNTAFAYTHAYTIPLYAPKQEQT